MGGKRGCLKISRVEKVAGLPWRMEGNTLQSSSRGWRSGRERLPLWRTLSAKSPAETQALARQQSTLFCSTKTLGVGGDIYTAYISCLTEQSKNKYFLQSIISAMFTAGTIYTTLPCVLLSQQQQKKHEKVNLSKRTDSGASQM